MRESWRHLEVKCVERTASKRGRAKRIVYIGYKARENEPLDRRRSVKPDINKLAVVRDSDSLGIAPRVLLPNNFRCGWIEYCDRVSSWSGIGHGKIEQLVCGIKHDFFRRLVHNLDGKPAG